MTLQAQTRPSRGVLLFAIGGILLAIGIVGIVLYATGAPDLIPAEAETTGLFRGLTVVGAGLATGVGMLLLVIGVVKRRSAHRGDVSRSSEAPR